MRRSLSLLAHLSIGIAMLAGSSASFAQSAGQRPGAPIKFQAVDAIKDGQVLKAWPELEDIKRNAPDLFANMTHYSAQVQTAYGPATLSMVVGGGQCGRQLCEMRVFLPGKPPMLIDSCSDPTAQFVTEDGRGLMACGKFVPFE
jgi:hypothetical protein